ncbi:MAG: MBL fold metallo-hydrolase [Haliscomenobacter sp.]|nr:MBL fold metallo-hydrolase [Haliscomenobacter sp.]MBK9490787.1 MBL fold metallo-hydrolase [Haliscomenobacter sp.]
MKIKFCGAAREVTGSCHLITLDDGYKILLDCGLYQGSDKNLEDFNGNWLFDPAEIDCLVLSHAHIDHAGRIPKLVKDGFRGAIHATHATRSLSSLMLLDSAMIQEREVEYKNKRRGKNHNFDDIAYEEPIYTSKDVHATMELFISYPYEKWFNVHPKVEVMFRDAGHILGSASVSLKIEENGKIINFGFSGDVGRPHRPILRDPLPMPEMDYLICESTYGDRTHEAAPAETDHFLRIIKQTCIEKGGKLLIPAFSVGRTQEIVYILDQMANEDLLPRIPVYVDSPLAVNATTIYGSHPECFDEELSDYLAIDENPFGFNGLHYVRKTEDSKKLNYAKEACIIIASSGMANAGRIKHHLYHGINDPNNTVLIVGYAAPYTPAGQLRIGAKEIKLFGEFITVQADVEIMDSFSAHADKLELVEFLRNQRESAKKIFLTHGDYEVQKSFRGLLLSVGFADVEIPALGEEIEL